MNTHYLGLTQHFLINFFKLRVLIDVDHHLAFSTNPLQQGTVLLFVKLLTC